MTGTWEGREFTRANKTKNNCAPAPEVGSRLQKQTSGAEAPSYVRLGRTAEAVPFPMFTHPTFHFRRQASGRSSYRKLSHFASCPAWPSIGATVSGVS